MMTTHIETKIKYNTPVIERIKLDNEISLALESTPPSGPGEASVVTTDYFNNDPFRQNKV